MSTDSAPHTVAGVSRKRTVVCASSGYGKADEVVERDQARVVVAVLEAERFGERVEQEGLAGAAAADEQQRVLGDEGREDRGLVAVEAVDAEVGEPKRRRAVRARCGRMLDMCRSFVARDRAASAEMARHLAELAGWPEHVLRS